jgi:hypothetical protein
MHIEWNILDSVLKYLFGEQDIIEGLKDMEEVGLKQHLWLHHDPTIPILKNPMLLICSHEMNNANFYHLFLKYEHL